MADPWANDPIVEPAQGGGQSAPWMNDPIVSGPRRQAGPRPQPRPSALSRPDPVAAERAQMDANLLPPSADPRTIPQPSAPLDPLTMPALDVPGAPQGVDVIAIAENGGMVTRSPDGALSYSDDVYSTSDERLIMEILRGSSGGEASTRSQARGIVDQNPGANRLAAFSQGAPALGSYVDEVAPAGAYVARALGQERSPASAAQARRQRASEMGLRPGSPEWVAFVGDESRETEIDPAQATQSVLAGSNAMETAYPGQTAALRTAGTLAYSVPLVMAGAPGPARETTRLAQGVRNLGWGAGLGGAEGAVYGFGEQQGEGRTVNATRQGLVGATLGGAAGVMVSALDRRILGQAQQLRGQSEAVIQEQLGVSPEAARMIRESLEGGELDRAIAVLQDRGPQALLAEASPALRQLLNVMTKTDIGAGNIAGRVVGQEANRRHGVMTDVLDDVLGSPQGVRDVQEGIMDATRGARSSSYNAAYGSPINYASESGLRLEGILQNRLPSGLIERANNALREAGEQSEQILARIADDGTVTFERPLNVAQIDYITRELQEMESAARRATGRTGDALRYGNLRREIRTLLGGDDQVPAYAEALAAGADAIGRREAVSLGSRALRMDRSELRFELRNLNSDAERQMVAQGLREQIDNLMARAGAIASDPEVPAREIRRVLEPLTSRQGLENVEAIVGNQGARQIREVVEQARAGLELRAAISRNSDTAITQAAQRRMGELVAPDLLEAASNMRVGEARDAIITSLAGDSAEATQLRTSGLAREIATILTSQTGEGAQRALRIINEYIENPRAMPDRDAQFVARMVTRAGALTAYLQGQNALTRQ